MERLVLCACFLVGLSCAGPGSPGRAGDADADPGAAGDLPGAQDPGILSDDAPVGSPDADAAVVPDGTGPYDVLVGPCKTCGNQADCGDPALWRCVPFGDGRFCLPVCETDATCPAGYICYPVTAEGRVCVTLSYQCVRCVYDQPCPAGTVCDLVSGACEPRAALCEPCSNDSGCMPGLTCAWVAGASSPLCVEGISGYDACVSDEDPCLGTCAPPFPFCARVDGQPRCVECDSDADCAGGPAGCVCRDHGCWLGEAGLPCEVASKPVCSSTADCQWAGLPAECHSTGVCYDPEGGCDGSVAACAPGGSCVDLGALLSGTSSTGAGFPGTCACGALIPCLADVPCTPAADVCADAALGPVFCPGGQPPTWLPDGLCASLERLAGMVPAP